MKHKLVHKQTGEAHICEKVAIDGWDYYVSDETVGNYHWYINTFLNKLYHSSTLKPNENSKKVIATNNPSIDIPKLVDEVDVLIETMVNLYLEKIKDLTKRFFWKAGFKHGYNKHQETHPFSEEDVRFMLSESFKASQEGYQITSDEIIQLWKEQRTKTLYYEKIT